MSRLHPTHLNKLLLAAQLAGQSGDLERAVRQLNKAIALAPGHAAAFCNRGLALQGLGRFDAALESYDRALTLKQDYAIAHFNRANLLKELGRNDDALSGYERAVTCSPGFALAHYNHGVLLQQLGSWDAAAASYDRAIAIDPSFAESHYNRGIVRQRREQWIDALADYDRAIVLKAGHAEAHCNRGVVLQRLERWDEALASFDRAIALDKDFANAYASRGHVLHVLKQFTAALESYDRAVDLGSDSSGLLGLRHHVRLQICEWTNFEAGLADIIAEIERGVPAAPPFHLLVASDSPHLQRRAAQAWARVEHPPNAALSPSVRRERRAKIHIGYFSADFRNHATSHLIAELFELHDREHFEVTAMSFGPDTADAIRHRVQSACDRFMDVRGSSDREVAELARRLDVDVAIDLMGFTNHCRPGIFALRAAPVQVSYLGFPGTMGVSYMDYLIADRTVIPEGREADYDEKIIHLPDCYQVNDRQRCIADPMFTREELGLPQEGFVFCCFNNSCKITPAIFDMWMRILKRVPGSVLWLLEDNAAAVSNLRQEAERREVPADRLVFGQRMPAPLHLARHRAADLFLDTLPYNAHTTASDALWAGLPLLTCPGTTFAGRVAASLLTAVDLPELIAATPAEYEERAIELAADPRRLHEFKSRLVSRRLSTALFDTPRFAQHLEAALRVIHERHVAGLAPDHLWV